MSNPRTTALGCELRRGCTFAEDFVSSARVTVNSGTVTGTGTVFARSATFDGTQHIDYDIIPHALGFSVVVRFSAAAVSTGILIANANLIAGTPADGFCVWVDSDGVKATYSGAAAIETALAVDLTYADNTIHTATYVVGASDHTLTVDAETPATAATTTAGPIGATTAIMVGGDGSDNFTGTIEKTRIFGSELTAGEHALYYADTLTSFVSGAWATYGCASFGDDTDGNYIWENKLTGRDLIEGDGSTASLMPVLVEYPTHHTDYYSFDGVDDYVSGWPTMPAAYTVSAALSAAYPNGQPYISQHNDTTVQTLLTTGGSLAGNLHNLIIFDYVLEPIQLYHLEHIQLARLWRDAFIEPFTSRMIREGVCIQAFDFLHPEGLNQDYSGTTTPVATDLTWTEHEGVTFGSTTSEVTSPDEADLRTDEITIHTAGAFDPDTTTRYLVSKGANYEFSIYTTGVYVRFAFNGRVSGLLEISDYSTIAVTCKDGTEPMFYVDGVHVSTALNPATMDDTDTDDLFVGNDEDGSNNLDMATRRVLVFNTRLSAAEIKYLHDTDGRATTVGATRPTVTDVDGDDIITSAQTNVVTTCTSAGATQGKVLLANNAALGLATVIVEQSIDSWSDTSIQYDADTTGLV